MKSQQNDPIYSQISQVKDAVAEVLTDKPDVLDIAASAAVAPNFLACSSTSATASLTCDI